MVAVDCLLCVLLTCVGLIWLLRCFWVFVVTWVLLIWWLIVCLVVVFGTGCYT